MEILSVSDLTFTYPGRTEPALKNVSFAVDRGEMVTLCGKSGSGKTTLMRMLKPELAPHGEKKGRIDFGSKNSSAGVGFVLQNPENQIVTDKVWHELAFGPENLGWDNETIRIRVAEMASYFGIQSWFRRDVAQLSGGQKQILNLAAVMVMKPEILLLDEPTSQLDPIAAEEFIDTVRKLNRETGVTVLITEHRLDNVLPASDRALVMDDGELIIDDTPENAAAVLAQKKHPMFRSMPASAQAYGMVYEAGLAGNEACPVDIRQGRMWIEKMLGQRNVKYKAVPEKKSSPAAGGDDRSDTAVELKNIWFRYEKDGEDILRGLSCTVRQGECFAIVGGNGTGKSTALKVMAGAVRAYRGKLKVAGGKPPAGKPAWEKSSQDKTAKKKSSAAKSSAGNPSEGKILMLPQNPQDVFAMDTVRAELLEMSDDIDETAELLEISQLLASHPYDISGGEQQRVALAKLLLADPDVILLDEPTKGMDNAFKEKLGNIFVELKDRGHTLIMVSHDIEFCARFADRCSMFFDGGITTTDVPSKFFSGNSFYTTAANKMSSEFFANAITPDDVGTLMCSNLKEGAQ